MHFLMSKRTWIQLMHSGAQTHVCTHTFVRCISSETITRSWRLCRPASGRQNAAGQGRPKDPSRQDSQESKAPDSRPDPSPRSRAGFPAGSQSATHHARTEDSQGSKAPDSRPDSSPRSRAGFPAGSESATHHARTEDSQGGPRLRVQATSKAEALQTCGLGPSHSCALHPARAGSSAGQGNRSVGPAPVRLIFNSTATAVSRGSEAPSKVTQNDQRRFSSL